jgi:hypothetical protein
MVHLSQQEYGTITDAYMASREIDVPDSTPTRLDFFTTIAGKEVMLTLNATNLLAEAIATRIQQIAERNCLGCILAREQINCANCKKRMAKIIRCQHKAGCRSRDICQRYIAQACRELNVVNCEPFYEYVPRMFDTV